MTPDEPTPAAAAPPDPAPAPPEAPPAPPASAPEPEPTVHAPHFDAMASMLSRGESKPEPSPAEPPVSPGDRPGRPVASPSPAPAPSAPATPDAPKRWGGRYETPEQLEQAYRETEARTHRAEQAAQKLERLLLASLEGRSPHPGQPAAPPPPPPPVTQWTQQTALAAIKEEAARLGLDDPQADPQRFIRAIAAALREDEEARSLYVAPTLAAIDQRNEQQRQIQTLQTAFYTQYPDLQGVRPDLLRQVAVETEARLARANPDTYGSPEFVKNWFEATAQEARATFRVSSASPTEGNGAASAPSPPPPVASKAPSAKPKGAPFAESPSPRPSEPALSGQALHLARVFGRPG